jgi:hypothetical protein
MECCATRLHERKWETKARGTGGSSVIDATVAHRDTGKGDAGNRIPVLFLVGADSIARPTSSGVGI